MGWVLCMRACVLSRFSRVRLSVTLWTVAHQAPLSMGFLRQEYWSGLPCPSPGNPPDPEVKPASLTSPVLASGFSTISTTWEAWVFVYFVLFKLHHNPAGVLLSSAHKWGHWSSERLSSLPKVSQLRSSRGHSDMRSRMLWLQSLSSSPYDPPASLPLLLIYFNLCYKWACWKLGADQTFQIEFYFPSDQHYDFSDASSVTANGLGCLSSQFPYPFPILY